MLIHFTKKNSGETLRLFIPDMIPPFAALKTALSIENNILCDIKIFDTIFNSYRPDAITLSNVTFERCVFKECDFENVTFIDCSMEDCDCSTSRGISISPESKTVKLMTNEEIEKKFKCKCKTLQNKDYVKCIFTCDFCHKDIVEIYKRSAVRTPMLDVPNCDRKVCRDCYSSYNLSDKFYGHRHYGYCGPVSRYVTAMDKANTIILGLEMEFEGDFYGWKELQDAHKGYLHYGYDSSVVGQNELSWDCGSYSWWKYISPLKEVCDVLKAHGGKSGDSAGIHIHASLPDAYMRTLAKEINEKCRSGKWNALMKAVSLRNNRERFDRYANLSLDETEHHSGISYNRHGTVEFRIFNSSLDHKLILRMIKFVKETVDFFTNTRKKVIYSPETRVFIQNSAKKQLDKGFITQNEYDLVIKEF